MIIGVQASYMIWHLPINADYQLCEAQHNWFIFVLAFIFYKEKYYFNPLQLDFTLKCNSIYIYVLSIYSWFNLQVIGSNLLSLSQFHVISPYNFQIGKYSMNLCINNYVHVQCLICVLQHPHISCYIIMCL